MKVNGKSQAIQQPARLSRNTGIIPPAISIRTKDFHPLLMKWRANFPQVPWTELLRLALRKELAPLAGKRYAHLVAEEKEGVAA